MSLVAAALVVALSALPGDKVPARPSSGASPRHPSSAGARSGPVPPTHVQAATADYLYKERRTILTGQPLVTFTREDATLVCRKAVAENDAQGEIQRATCEGDVKLTRGGATRCCATAAPSCTARRSSTTSTRTASWPGR